MGRITRSSFVRPLFSCSRQTWLICQSVFSTCTLPSLGWLAVWIWAPPRTLQALIHLSAGGTNQKEIYCLLLLFVSRDFFKLFKFCELNEARQRDESAYSSRSGIGIRGRGETLLGDSLGRLLERLHRVRGSEHTVVFVHHELIGGGEKFLTKRLGTYNISPVYL